MEIPGHVTGINRKDGMLILTMMGFKGLSGAVLRNKAGYVVGMFQQKAKAVDGVSVSLSLTPNLELARLSGGGGLAGALGVPGRDPGGRGVGGP